MTNRTEIIDPQILEAKEGAYKRLLGRIFYTRVEGIDDSQQLFKSVDESMISLDPREARVLRERFGLSGKEKRKLREVGENLPRRSPSADGGMVGVGRERVRQIEVLALRKLRHGDSRRRLLEAAGLSSPLQE